MTARHFSDSQKDTRSRTSGILVFVGVLLFTLAYGLLTMFDLSSLRSLSSETLQSASRHLSYSLEQTASRQAEALTALGDKARGLAKFLSSSDSLSEAQKLEFCREQRVSGFLVLDEALEPVSSFSAEQGNAPDLVSSLPVRMLDELSTRSQAQYLAILNAGNSSYETAVIPRNDTAGFLLVYQKCSDSASSDQTAELSEIFSDYSLRKGGTLLLLGDGTSASVTERSMADDGISQNPEETTGSFYDADQTSDQLTENEVILSESVNSPFPFSFDLNTRSFGFLKAEFQNQVWYGDCLRSEGYTICVLFPYSEVFRQRSTVCFCIITLYVAFFLLFSLIRSREQEKSLTMMNQQYRIIEAIGNIYTTIFMVDLNTDILTPVTVPDELLSDLDQAKPASQILDEWAVTYVDEPFVKAHKAFMNVSSASSRLAGISHLELNYQLKTGAWYKAIMIPKRFDKDRNVEAILIVTRDVSSEIEHEMAINRQLRETAEEAERANAAKTDFLRRMSHDIRTPINGIRGMVEIGNHFPNNLERQAECRRKIWEASDFLLDLVNNVLDMNKLESGELHLEEVPFSLKQVSGEVASIIRPQAAEHGLTLLTGKLQVSHFDLIGSPLYLRQILLNLAGNAVKYNRPGGTVQVSCLETDFDETHASLCFVVSDTGLGMTKEFQEHLFEPFSQEHTAVHTTYTGTGLGLSITKKLIEAMGGSITFVSEIGVGTSFTVTLPFRINHEASEKVQEQSLPAGALRGLHVLLAEDNELNREIAEFLLRNEGISVTSAENGSEALRLFRNAAPGTFDVILMDVMMPVMDGLEATRRLRALERPDAKTVPVFAMTANAFADDIRRCKDAGMNEHLSKPLDSEKLFRTIYRYCKKK